MPCSSCLGPKQVLVRTTMVKKKLRRRTPPISSFPECIFKETECHGFSVAVPDHPFFYKDQTYVAIIGSGEPIFQPQALVASVHRAAIAAAVLPSSADITR